MLKNLILTRFQAMFYVKPREGKKQRKMGIYYALLAIYLIFVFGGMFVAFYSQFYKTFVVQMHDASTYFALSAITSSMLAFVGSVMMTQHQLYMAKDNELLLSMPIKPSEILFSRILALYGWAFIFSALSLVPCIGVYVAKEQSVSAFTIFVMVFEVIFLPLLSLTISFIMAWLLQLGSSRVKNKSLFTIVGTFIFFGLYMAFCMRMNQFVMYIAERGEEVAVNIHKYFYPFYLCGDAMGNAGLSSFVLMLLVVLAPFAIAYYVLSKTFIKIATTERGMIKTEYKAKKMAGKSVKTAITMKEIERFYKCPTYAVNGGLGLLMQLIGAIYLAINADEAIGLAYEITDGMIGRKFFVAIMVLLVGSLGTMSGISVASISLEGKNLWILKSSPITAYEVLKGKLNANLILAVPFSFAAGVALNFIPGMNIFERIMAIYIPVVMSIFCAYFGLAVNLKLPKLEWNNENQAIKQSGAAFVAVFGSMGLIILFIFLFVFTYTILDGDLFMGVTALLFTIGCILYEFYLRNKGSRRFEEL